MKFDANLAWKDAIAAISANRSVLLPLAGVFILLPTLAFGIFYPEPAVTSDDSPKVAWAMMRENMIHALPGLIPMAILEAIGTLAMLTLFTDSARPNVGEAIRRGAGSLIPYLLAQLLVGVVIGLAASVLLGIVMATGVKALVVLVGLILIAGLLYAAVRTGLIAPVVGVEGQRNPVQAIRRSLALTQGQTGPLALFIVLLLVAMIVISALANMVFGTLFALLGAGALGKALISAIMGAVVTVLTTSLLAVIHRQLSSFKGQ